MLRFFANTVTSSYPEFVSRAAANTRDCTNQMKSMPYKKMAFPFFQASCGELYHKVKIRKLAEEIL